MKLTDAIETLQQTVADLKRGQEALKEQTVRIRKAATGSSFGLWQGTDTEVLVRELRERIEKLESNFIQVKCLGCKAVFRQAEVHVCPEPDDHDEHSYLPEDAQ